MPNVAARILLVEDERNVGSTLAERLREEGFEVTWATTAREAALEASRRFDLALVDVGLPDGSGFDVAQGLRREHGATAIVFLTAFGSPENRVRGLELGAEDYVVKPFHLRELLLRVRNGLRRAKSLALRQAESDARVGKSVVRFARFEIEAGGEIHPLTHKECAILRLLHGRRGHVVSRDEILNEVWADDEFPSSRTVDNFMVRLRRWVEPDPENPQVIRSVRGVGYQLCEGSVEPKGSPAEAR